MATDMSGRQRLLERGAFTADLATSLGTGEPWSRSSNQQEWTRGLLCGTEGRIPSDQPDGFAAGRPLRGRQAARPARRPSPGHAGRLDRQGGRLAADSTGRRRDARPLARRRVGPREPAGQACGAADRGRSAETRERRVLRGHTVGELVPRRQEGSGLGPGERREDRHLRRRFGGSRTEACRSGRIRARLRGKRAVAEWASCRRALPENQVVLCPVDGGQPRSIPGLTGFLVPVQWSADGKGFYVFRLGEIPARVDKIDVDSGRATHWKELAPPDTAGVSAPGACDDARRKVLRVLVPAVPEHAVPRRPPRVVAATDVLVAPARPLSAPSFLATIHS